MCATVCDVGVRQAGLHALRVETDGSKHLWWAADLTQCIVILWLSCGVYQQCAGARPAWSVGMVADLRLWLDVGCGWPGGT